MKNTDRESFLHTHCNFIIASCIERNLIEAFIGLN